MDINTSSLPQNDNGGDAHPKQGHDGSKPEQNRKVWIAPTIFGLLTTIAIVVPGLNGLWHDWWVEWILVPGLIATGAIGIYEVCEFLAGISRKWSIFIGLLALIVLAGGIVTIYRVFPETKKPELLPTKTISPPQTPLVAASEPLSNSTLVYPANSSDCETKYANAAGRHSSVDLAFACKDAFNSECYAASIKLFNRAKEINTEPDGWKESYPFYIGALLLSGHTDEGWAAMREMTNQLAIEVDFDNQHTTSHRKAFGTQKEIKLILQYMDNAGDKLQNLKPEIFQEYTNFYPFVETMLSRAEYPADE